MNNVMGMGDYLRLSKQDSEALFFACNEDDVVKATRILSIDNSEKGLSELLVNPTLFCYFETFVDAAIFRQSAGVLRLLLTDSRITNRILKNLYISSGSNDFDTIVKKFGEMFRTGFYYRNRFFHVFDIFAKSKFIKDKYHSNGLLAWAIQMGELSLVKELMEREDIDPTSQGGLSIRSAIGSGSVEITSLFLERIEVRSIISSKNDFMIPQSAYSAVKLGYLNISLLVLHSCFRPQLDNHLMNYCISAVGGGHMHLVEVFVYLIPFCSKEIVELSILDIFKCAITCRNFMITKYLLNHPNVGPYIDSDILNHQLFNVFQIHNMSYLILVCDPRFNREVCVSNIKPASQLLDMYGPEKLPFCLSLYLETISCIDRRLNLVDIKVQPLMATPKVIAFRLALQVEADAMMKIIRDDKLIVANPLLLSRPFLKNDTNNPDDQNNIDQKKGRINLALYLMNRSQYPSNHSKYYKIK